MSLTYGHLYLYREYGTIDDVDIDLHINISFLDEEVSTAWKVLRTEPIVLRLRFSLSQYLDGPGKGSDFRQVGALNVV